MPFKSRAQRRKFAELLIDGKISAETFEEWNRETGARTLPERAARKPAVARRSAAARTRGGSMAKYGRKASEKVEKVMHERKKGTLRSGGSGRKVTSRKQAIAIGLSEARRAGGKVPPRKSSSKKSSSRKSAARKSSARKSSSRKTSRKSSTRKSSRKSSSSKKK
jgi:uncharacterized protein DUF6496